METLKKVGLFSGRTLNFMSHSLRRDFVVVVVVVVVVDNILVKCMLTGCVLVKSWLQLFYFILACFSLGVL